MDTAVPLVSNSRNPTFKPTNPLGSPTTKSPSPRKIFPLFLLSFLQLITTVSFGEAAVAAAGRGGGRQQIDGMKRFRPAQEGEMERISMANVLLLFSGAAPDEGDHGGVHHPGERVFECKTCSRRFPSFQALGGHRASHKKPRLVDQNGQPQQSSSPTAPAKPRVHECSVCGLEFAIGQALGGHMRRHRVTAEVGAVPHALVEAKPAAAAVAVPCGGGGGKREVPCLGLDLNLPPCENDKDFLTLGFGVGLHMVDCLH